MEDINQYIYTNDIVNNTIVKWRMGKNDDEKRTDEEETKKGEGGQEYE